MLCLREDLRKKEGSIDTFIKRDRINRKKFTADTADGKHALTDYKVLKEYDKFSLCLIKLHTGRTHQIRVHMSHLGNPVLGDPVYCRKDRTYPDASLMLHAFVLCIDIPGKGECSSQQHFRSVLKSCLEKAADFISGNIQIRIHLFFSV